MGIRTGTSIHDEVLRDISVIVPFTGADLAWKDLLQDLKALPMGAEILLVGPEAPDQQILSRAAEGLLAEVRYVYSAPGRGRVLNAGARVSSKGYFWFLHADSKVPRPSIHLLSMALLAQPGSLHYFNLQFLADGPRWVGLNSFAANLRSKHLGLPFGDQGFAVSRTVFLRIGGFSETAVGEDHIFVWEARRKRIPLHNIPASIFTSARRYEAEGWASLTRSRIYQTAKRAVRESLKLIKTRVIEGRTARLAGRS